MYARPVSTELALRTPRQQALLLYLLPALMDTALSLVLFVGTIRVARLGGDATQSAAILAVWSGVYIASCPFIGRWVSARNARHLALAGCLLFSVASLGMALAAQYAILLTLVGVTGLASALFFIAFQLFMRECNAATGRSLPYSVGMYTFAWSLGFAFGPLVSGLIMQYTTVATGWRIAFLTGAGITLGLSAILARAFRAPAQQVAAPKPPTEPRTAVCYAGCPNLVWLGWLVAATGFIALSLNRTVFNARAVADLHMADGALGLILFAIYLVQALTGLALVRSRCWMYRPLPAVAFTVPGIMGLLCLAYGEHLALLVTGAALFGLYSGAFCFYLVFHALVRTEQAGKYVAVNETIIGVSCFIGPLIGGRLADAYGFALPFLVATGLVLATLITQVIVVRRLTALRRPVQTH
jgi:MFS family permease